jgi:lysozyme
MHPKTTSDQGINLIKKFEGLAKEQDDGMIVPYRCAANVLTIGYGHTKGVKKIMRITKDEAEQLLRDDLKVFEREVKNLVTVPLTQYQFDALVSWCFNVGAANVKSSTLLKKLNASDYSAVPAQLMRWNKARVNGVLKPLNGLTRRRSAEAALFTMDSQLPSDDPDVPMAQKVTVQDKKPLTKSKTMAGVGIAGAATGLNEVAGQLEGLASYSGNLQTIFLICAVGGIALAAFARWKDQKDGVDV